MENSLRLKFGAFLLLGFLLGSISFGIGMKMSYNKYLDAHVCMSNENYDKIISLFMYDIQEYDEAQKWWNTSLKNISYDNFYLNFFPPSFRNQTEP